MTDERLSGQRIGLVGCVKQKCATAAAAEDLYVSTLFEGRRSAVERSCDRWFVLSALHGVVAPDDVIEPYDATLTAATRSQRRGWSLRVLAQLDERCGELAGRIVEIHAGKDYYDFGLVEGLAARGARVELPTRGIRLGEQLRFYRGER